jgi:hypothetical protein
VIFLFDENIIEHVTRMLAAFDRENEMRHAVDHFDRGTADTDWIPVVASWKGRPVAVCADGRILRNKVERQTLKEAGLMFVYMASGWTNTPWEDYAWKIIKVWPHIVRNVSQARFPMVFEVSVGLKVQQIGRIDHL